ncbi:hypothetical protein [Xanthomonas arboricola]|uniref:hypothetical protein n=1 Tax=Xanthomonas arboricola TaxID=56448 RepID=UPI0017EFF100|nr:hypothetical protein [Xanthomonas arboricola]MBB4595587.1 hypothetical protein [Xanthomonas arboricola]
MALLAKALGAAAWSLVTHVAMRPGAVFIELPLAFIDSRSTNLKKRNSRTRQSRISSRSIEKPAAQSRRTVLKQSHRHSKVDGQFSASGLEHGDIGKHH